MNCLQSTLVPMNGACKYPKGRRQTHRQKEAANFSQKQEKSSNAKGDSGQAGGLAISLSGNLKAERTSASYTGAKFKFVKGLKILIQILIVIFSVLLLGGVIWTLLRRNPRKLSRR